MQFTDPQFMLLALALFWFGGAAVMSRLAGWHVLSRLYPAPLRLTATEYRFATVHFGKSSFPIKYRRCVRLLVTGQGFGMCLMFPFRFSSPPFFAPWASVSGCVEKQSLVTRTVTLQFAGTDHQATFSGVLGQELKAAFEQFRGGTKSAA